MNCLTAIKTTSEDYFQVEYEVLTPVDFAAITNPARRELAFAMQDVDVQLSRCNAELEKLSSEIDRLTNHADGLDYTIAVLSGVLAGVIDSVWVGEFSLDRANSWGKDKVDNFVVSIAQKQGYKGNDLPGAISFLEKKYPIAADKATNDFGGGLQHHLRDFSHHPTPIGLLFSLLTQFTEKVYGTDVAGVFKIVPVSAEQLIGKNIAEKVTFGIVHWFFHIVSDMAGSSTSAGKGNLGTGLPGPFVSLLKEISALPFFRNMNDKGYKEFSVWISKLFNGTLLGKRDEKGNLLKAVPFDLRTEIGAVHELGRQAIPVIINECIVRGFYFSRRLTTEIKEKQIISIADLKKIDWQSTLPFKNRTVERMITIATGTFTAVDIADAAIRSGGFNPACLLRVNFVGVGRFAIAIGTDVGMGIKRGKLQNERYKLIGQQLDLLDVKVSYLCAATEYEMSDAFNEQNKLWIAAEDTVTTLLEANNSVVEAMVFYQESLQEISDNLEQISGYLAAVEEKNPGLVKETLDTLRWGK